MFSLQAFKMMNTSGNFSGCSPQPVPTFIPIFLGFFFFFGFALNCISLWIFWFKVKPWNSMVILQFNLAISDAIITPAAPLLVIYYITNQWTFGLLLCQFKVFLLSTHTYGSIYFLALISVHRYFTIVPNTKWKSFSGKPFITKLCLFVWGCLLCQGIPFFFVIKTSKVHGVLKCLNNHQRDQSVLFFAWNWVILFTGLLIPFSITLVSYALLIRYILKVHPMNSLSKVMVSKSVQTILVSLIIFVIRYIPSHTTRSIAVTITLFFPNSCSLMEGVEVAFYITWIVSETNCYMDPIMYCFASKKFKRIFTSWFDFRRRQDEKVTDYSHDNPTEASIDRRCPNPLPTINYLDTGLSGSAEQ